MTTLRDLSESLQEQEALESVAEMEAFLEGRGLAIEAETFDDFLKGIEEALKSDDLSEEDKAHLNEWLTKAVGLAGRVHGAVTGARDRIKREVGDVKAAWSAGKAKGSQWANKVGTGAPKPAAPKPAAPAAPAATVPSAAAPATAPRAAPPAPQPGQQATHNAPPAPQPGQQASTAGAPSTAAPPQPKPAAPQKPAQPAAPQKPAAQPAAPQKPATSQKPAPQKTGIGQRISGAAKGAVQGWRSNSPAAKDNKAVAAQKRQQGMAAAKKNPGDVAVNRMARKAAKAQARSAGPKMSSLEVDIHQLISESRARWIQKAIQKKGALHKSLGVPGDEKIPAGKLKAAAGAPGKLGRRARLAVTLKKLHK